MRIQNFLEMWVTLICIGDTKLWVIDRKFTGLLINESEGFVRGVEYTHGNKENKTHFLISPL